jgi:hypothetical protein
MARSAFSKVISVGRATVFMVGLAVLLALVLGLASTALGATGGNLLLGKLNAAETPTSLVATLTDAIKPALSVQNKSGGPALNLGVDSEQAPIRVNAGAGTATNLSADELDGKDSSAFLGKTEKAADSAKLGGQDSSAFAGFGESVYAAGGAVTPCVSVELASIPNISVSRPSRILASGAMVYFPGHPANSLKYGEITVELRDSSNNTVASAGKAYASTTGAEDLAISRQGVLMNGTNPNTNNTPFVAQPGATYTLRLVGRSSSGTCDNNNPPYMKDSVLSYVLIGATK